MDRSRAILLTGASRGIGRATALRLAASGWTVYAGVRTSADGEALAAEAGTGIVPVELDVTSPRQIEALEEVLPDRLHAVINNAGIIADGPIEAVDTKRLREVFEVNVFGCVAVTQAVLPRLRRGRGRVVIVSSLSGRVATPWTGVYCASKAAIESIGDGLRIELRPWGIPVSLIEPSATATEMWSDADAMVEATAAAMSPAHRHLYAGHIEGVRRGVVTMQQRAVPVPKVVDVIEKAVESRSPRARYLVGIESRLALIGASLTPTHILDRVLAAGMRFPKRVGEHGAHQ